MGSICGMVASDGTLARQSVERMSAALTYRGDEHATAHSASWSVAVQSSTGSALGADLFTSDAGFCAFEGRLQGMDERARSLGLPPDTPDAEVLWHGFRRKREGFLDELDGAYALVVGFDGKVYAARDFFGARCLYFSLRPDGIRFSSDLMSLLRGHDTRPSLSQEAISAHLTWGVGFGSSTFFESIHKVSQGFLYTVVPSEGFKRTAAIPKTRNLRSGGLAEYADEIWRNVQGSLRHSVVPNGRVAVLMSAGIDSTLLGAALAELEIARTEAVTCSYGRSDLQGDETAIAKMVARQLQLPLKEVVTDVRVDLREELRRVVRALEQPTRFAIALPISRLMSKLREEPTQLVTGLFADRLFGQDDHATARSVRSFARLPAAARGPATLMARAGTRFARTRPSAQRFLDGQFESQLDLWLHNLEFNRDLRGLTPRVDLDELPFIGDVREAIESHSDLDAEAEISLCGILMMTGNFSELFGRLAEPAGVEVLYPFGGREQFRLAMGMPGWLKHHRGVEKPALRILSERYFGDELTRLPKQMFSAPYTHWMVHSVELSDLVNSLGSSEARVREVLDARALAQVVDEANKARIVGEMDWRLARMCFSLAGLELWLQEFDN